MQAITTKFIAPTNTRGSRVQVKSWLGTTYSSWDHAQDSTENHLAAVRDHLDKKASATAPVFPAAAGSLPDSTGYCVIVQHGPVADSARWGALL